MLKARLQKVPSGHQIADLVIKLSIAIEQAGHNIQVGQRFTIRSVMVIQVQSVAAILAPNYRFYPNDTTEASQVVSGMQAYKVRPAKQEKP